jgi:Pentapeptide repeats (8 copies)
MNHMLGQSLAVFAAFLALLVPARTEVQKQQEWTWKGFAGETRTRADLDKILQEHKLWLDSGHTLGKRMFLNSVDLTGARLTDANLTRVDLRGVDLGGADLGGADLTDAELKDANFLGAYLQGVIYEPKSIPDFKLMARANGLEFMTYRDNPDSLVQLRKQFEESGFRTQERKITYALNRRRAELHGPLERGFSRVAFDLTCQYGMNPGRALQIWLAVLASCWLIYTVFIFLPGDSGIYRIPKRDGEVDGKDPGEKLRYQPDLSKPFWRTPIRLILQVFRALFWAGFFSLMSAFNIGFRDIDFGRWLRLLPRTEYDLKAKGWARTVAGFQSLISVYMIALWVLTYFGRPFE